MMKAQRAFDLVLDLFFPRRCPYCGAVVGFVGRCACDADRAPLALPEGPLPTGRGTPARTHLAAVYARYRYAEPVAGAIARMKYRDSPELAAPLAEEMARLFAACGLGGAYDLLSPVPMGPEAFLERGYNQTALLAEALSAHTGLPVAKAALHKTRETAHQMALSRAERLENLKDAFAAAEPMPVAGARVLLVDDVVTTGSTLNECAKTLLAAGAKGVGALCLAAALQEDAPPA